MKYRETEFNILVWTTAEIKVFKQNLKTNFSVNYLLVEYCDLLYSYSRYVFHYFQSCILSKSVINKAWLIYENKVLFHLGNYVWEPSSSTTSTFSVSTWVNDIGAASCFMLYKLTESFQICFTDIYLNPNWETHFLVFVFTDLWCPSALSVPQGKSGKAGAKGARGPQGDRGLGGQKGGEGERGTAQPGDSLMMTLLSPCSPPCEGSVATAQDA